MNLALRNRVTAHVDLTALSDEEIAYALWYGLRQIMIDNRHFASLDPNFGTISESIKKGMGA